MKKFSKFLVALAIGAVATTAFAASKGNDSSNAATALRGIITPDIATSTVIFDYYTVLKETGEFGICATGEDTSNCPGNVYLTPEQYVAKFYPKARYVGYQLYQSSRTATKDTFLYLYMKKAP